MNSVKYDFRFKSDSNRVPKDMATEKISSMTYKNSQRLSHEHVYWRGSDVISQISDKISDNYNIMALPKKFPAHGVLIKCQFCGVVNFTYVIRKAKSWL